MRTYARVLILLLITVYSVALFFHLRSSNILYQWFSPGSANHLILRSAKAVTADEDRDRSLQEINDLILTTERKNAAQQVTTKTLQVNSLTTAKINKTVTSNAKETATSRLPNSTIATPMTGRVFPKGGTNEMLPDRVKVANGDVPTMENLTATFSSVPSLPDIRNSIVVDNGTWPVVAVVISFRDRESHFRALLYVLHSMLPRQPMHYHVFLVEQAGNQTFNKGRILNVGFREALKLLPFTCFVFHDVDLLPMHDIAYRCFDQPEHYSIAIDKYNFKNPYKTLFGGVFALTPEQYIRANGFSNSFWGWGGEDDDLECRMRLTGLNVTRHPETAVRYKTFKHRRDKLNQTNNCRYKLLHVSRQRQFKDGLATVDYDRLNMTHHKLYTHLLIDVHYESGQAELKKEGVCTGPSRGWPSCKR